MVITAVRESTLTLPSFPVKLLQTHHGRRRRAPKVKKVGGACTRVSGRRES